MAASALILLLAAAPTWASAGGIMLVTLPSRAFVPFGYLNASYSVYDSYGVPASGEGELGIFLEGETASYSFNMSAPSRGSFSVELGAVPSGRYVLRIEFNGSVEASFSTEVLVGPLTVALEAPDSLTPGKDEVLVVRSAVSVEAKVEPFPGARCVFEARLNGQVVDRKVFRTGSDGSYALMWRVPAEAQVGDLVELRAYGLDPPSAPTSRHYVISPPGELLTLSIPDPRPLAGSTLNVTINATNAEKVFGPMVFATYTLSRGGTPVESGLTRNDSFELEIPEGVYGDAVLNVSAHFGGGVLVNASARLNISWCRLYIMPSGIREVNPGNVSIGVQFYSPIAGSPQILLKADAGGVVLFSGLVAPAVMTTVRVPRWAEYLEVEATAVLNGMMETAVATYRVVSPPPRVSVIYDSPVSGVVVAGSSVIVQISENSTYLVNCWLGDSVIASRIVHGPASTEVEIPPNETGTLTIKADGPGHFSTSLAVVPGKAAVEATQKSKVLSIRAWGLEGQKARILVYGNSLRPLELESDIRNGTLEVRIPYDGVAGYVVVEVLSSGTLVDMGYAQVRQSTSLVYKVLYGIGALLIIVAAIWWAAGRRS